MSLATNSKRPLSPHLQVYRPQMTSMLSILHRATGLALMAGTLLVMVWLLALMAGPGPYGALQGFMASPLGLFMLAGWSFSLYYHLFNGLRHLLWDMGYLFEMTNATRAGYAVLALSLIATLSTWYCALNF